MNIQVQNHLNDVLFYSVLIAFFVIFVFYERINLFLFYKKTTSQQARIVELKKEMINQTYIVSGSPYQRMMDKYFVVLKGLLTEAKNKKPEFDNHEYRIEVDELKFHDLHINKDVQIDIYQSKIGKKQKYKIR